MAAPRPALPDPYPVRPRGPLDARVRVPGSRSLTNRALLCAALASGESLLEGATASDDTDAMREGLVSLGAAVEPRPAHAAADGTLRPAHAAADGTLRPAGWAVRGTGGRLGAPARTLDARASGTTARFLTAAATLAAGPCTLDGTPRMRERPIRDLVDALRRLGAAVEYLGRDGYPPLRIAGGGLPGGAASIDARRSSQYVSAILMVAPCAARDVELRFEEGALVSRPFAEMTLDVMRAFGAEAELTADGARVRAGQGYAARRFAIEPDAQSAVYAFAAAAVAGGRVRVLDLPGHSRQADLRFVDALERMGCRALRGDDFVEVEAPAAGLRGLEIDGAAMPDAVLALAVVAAFAGSPTRITNVANLRIKESDRLAALETELRRLGAGASAGPDWLVVEPRPLHAARIATYDDHRIAMSFAIAGLRVPGVAIADPGCVAKTWPEFFAALEGW
jgi:3-phosphoshikimate 1-carboxyvinyltransferase